MTTEKLIEQARALNDVLDRRARIRRAINRLQEVIASGDPGEVTAQLNVSEYDRKKGQHLMSEYVSVPMESAKAFLQVELKVTDQKIEALREEIHELASTVEE